jgi:hypothetical protein
MFDLTYILLTILINLILAVILWFALAPWIGKSKGLPFRLDKNDGEGQQEGAKQALHRLMSRQVGNVPPNIAARLDSLTPEQLNDLAEALFDFKSHDDVEGWLNRHGKP